MDEIACAKSVPPHCGIVDRWYGSSRPRAKCRRSRGAASADCDARPVRANRERLCAEFERAIGKRPCVDRVEHDHDRIVLTRNGRAAAVIMSPADLEALEDTLELLSDRNALKEIRRAKEEVTRGRVVSAEELRSKYLGR